jgi:hypothetical protein
MRDLMRQAGFIPKGATDEDIDAAMSGAKRERDRRRQRLEHEFGGSGVVAHVQAFLQDNGLANFAAAAVAKGAFGPDLPSKNLFADLLNAHGKPVAQKGNVNVNVKIEQTINNADDPERVMIETHRALRDALIRPIESTGALVLKWYYLLVGIGREHQRQDSCSQVEQNDRPIPSNVVKPTGPREIRPEKINVLETITDERVGNACGKCFRFARRAIESLIRAA